MLIPLLRRLSLSLLLCCSGLAGADTIITPALGYGKLGYPLPAAGSYPLPPLGQAADGQVLDAAGKSRSLHQLFEGHYVLLGFIYSSCSDVNGCPLTAHVFYQIKTAMQDDPALAEKLKLISLSFDPRIDTPQTMALYANNFKYAGNAGEWQFLTTESEQMLDPILKSYNQQIQRNINSDGSIGVNFSHILRVFLIDPQRRIRNIYSVDFLHHQLVLNDIRTLIMQDQRRADPVLVATSNGETRRLSQPGDSKVGYERPDYTTDSLALPQRQGRPGDLMRPLTRPPLGLPPIPQPADNPITREKVALGRKLFFDRRLSLNDTFSCAMCHIPEQGFTSNELAMAVGVEGRSVRRNSPTLYNSAYSKLLFHDGREETLEQQAWGPLLARNEMANPSIGHLLNKIRQIDDYQGLFEQAFNGKGISMETLGMALASYQRVLVSADSPFDRWYYGNQSDALSPAAKHGFRLFTGEAGCVTCHTIGESHALFSDDQLHNTGIGYRESMGIRPRTRLVQVAPGITIEVEQSIIDSVSEPTPADVGRYEVTQNPHDRWKYKTPSLRNIALTAPYMHNGSFSTLQEVIEFYDAGGMENPLLDPLIRPLGLSTEEKQALLAFLKALTGSNVEQLVADAFAAPVGDIRKGDPSWVHGTAVEAH